MAIQVSGTEVISDGRILKVADGTAGAPSMTFSGDTNTGWYRIGANNWAGAQGGSIFVEFLSGGDVDFKNNVTVDGTLSVAGNAVYDTGDEATSGEILNNTANKLITTDRAWAAASTTVGLTSGATVNIDFSAGIDFNLSMTSNCQLANPTNIKVGQRGVIRVREGSGGPWTLTWGSYYVFPGGNAPSPANGTTDYYSYYVYNATTIVIGALQDVQ